MPLGQLNLLEDMRTLEGIDTSCSPSGEPMNSVVLEDMRTLEGIDTPV